MENVVIDPHAHTSKRIAIWLYGFAITKILGGVLLISWTLIKPLIIQEPLPSEKPGLIHFFFAGALILYFPAAATKDNGKSLSLVFDALSILAIVLLFYHLGFNPFDLDFESFPPKLWWAYIALSGLAFSGMGFNRTLGKSEEGKLAIQWCYVTLGVMGIVSNWNGNSGPVDYILILVMYLLLIPYYIIRRIPVPVFLNKLRHMLRELKWIETVFGGKHGAHQP
ncbi:MAG TPA: hypothetical protein VGQ08_17070 [Nitrospiraceae bacterium]|nr:hypothetical protein [Nitrospiraceae bacterium]